MSTTTTGQPEARELKKGSLAAFRGLLPFLKPYRNRFIVAGIALVVAAGSTLAIPYAFKQMIDLGFGANAGVSSAQHVNSVFLALFAVFVLYHIAYLLVVGVPAYLKHRQMVVEILIVLASLISNAIGLKNGSPALGGAAPFGDDLGAELGAGDALNLGI